MTARLVAMRWTMMGHVSVDLSQTAVRRKNELFGIALRAAIDALGRHLVGGRLDIGQIDGTAAMVTGRQEERVDLEFRCAIHVRCLLKRQSFPLPRIVPVCRI